MFESLPSTRTGIEFSNTISYDKNFNIITYPYLYNGGGVAVGDINNDGLEDLYLTGNMVSSRLYLNMGNFEFKDITQSAGTATKGWANGVSMVDINNDGYLDIYVSISGTDKSTPGERTNLLFINQGDQTFIESGAEYGLADSGFTTDAAFFDYDRDGDLDVFLISNFPGSFSRDSKIKNRQAVNDGSSKSTDVLYRNDGGKTFTKVSRQAGILKEGYSLGVAICDLNRDGWPDIYVSNDIQTDDLLYINNGNGTFTDKANVFLKHTSYSGMGVDVADFNGDGWPDILQADMMPHAFRDQKMIAGTYVNPSNQNKSFLQYTSNTLQLSNGRDNQGNVIFSEISQLAGISSTDWSWSALFGDYDNDGLKDIMITNGYLKAVTNLDYLIKLHRSTMFGTDSTRNDQSYEMMDKLKALKAPNYFYKNNGNLTFSDVSKSWGFTEPTFSYGATYADLDNDGDLDIIINNINDKAQVFKNQADSLVRNHYLGIRLKGSSLNSGGIGSKLVLSVNGRTQYAMMQPYRGYQSGISENVHFGLGNNDRVDTLKIYWPDGHYQQLTNIKADRVITLSYNQAANISAEKKNKKSGLKRFIDVSNELNIYDKHTENKYNDYIREPLLPHMFSRLGPDMATGDVNNDDRLDFFIGGAAGQAGRLYVQHDDGTFMSSVDLQPWNADRSYEDMGVLFFDANSDGHVDLYVVSGGYALSPLSDKFQDRLYMNDGHGRFAKSQTALPRMYTSGSCVKAGDYDGDGDLDLFVGGRVIPGKYPQPAQSYLLRNDHGTFKNVTQQLASQLQTAGLVTDALWVDFDGDGKLDLVTAGEWSPVRFYRNKNQKFEDVTSELGLKNETGWWNSLADGDFDQDGDIDIVAGNLGLNSRFTPSQDARLEVFVSDFDHNGTTDAILSFLKKRRHIPLPGKFSMVRQLPAVNRRVSSFEEYAEASVEKLTGVESLGSDILHYQMNNSATSYFENNGNGSFTVTPLPVEAQFSTVNDIVPLDVNEDGYLDLILAGNMFNVEPDIPRSDAGNGLWLKGDGKGHFSSVPSIQSGFIAPENVKDLEFMEAMKGRILLVANNDDSLQVFKILKSSNH